MLDNFTNTHISNEDAKDREGYINGYMDSYDPIENSGFDVNDSLMHSTTGSGIVSSVGSTSGSATLTSLSCGTNPGEIIGGPTTLLLDEINASTMEMNMSFYNTGVSTGDSIGMFTNDQSPGKAWAIASTTLSTCSSGAGGPEGIILLIPDDGTCNAVAVDRVEANAKKIFDQYDHNHNETKVGNSALITKDINILKEMKKLIAKKEKNFLLTELEALKQYKEKDLTLKK